MKTQLSTATAASPQRAALRSMAAFGGVSVDVERSAILNAAVITIGMAAGHGFAIDGTTLDQVAALINAKPNGVPVRFTHPEAVDGDGHAPETLGRDVGYLRNARVEGQSVRGDVYLGDYAEVLPGLGNVKDYLLRKAKSDPTGFGLSAVIAFDVEPIGDGAGNVTSLVARVGAVDAVDFVGNPAANPNGLLAAKEEPVIKTVQAIQPNQLTASVSGATTNGVNPMPYDSKMKSILSAKFGLAEGADDEAANKLFDELPDEKKKEIEAEMSAAATPAPATLSAKRQTAADADKAHDEFLALEGKRVAQLRQLGTFLSVDDATIQSAIAAGDDVIAARKKYLVHLSEKCKPLAGVSVGPDKKVAMLAAAMPDAIAQRAGFRKFYQVDTGGRVMRDSDGNPVAAKAHDMAERYASLSVLDMYRQWLIAFGAPHEEVSLLSRAQLCELLGNRNLRRRFPMVAQLAQSTSDFANVILDAQNKTLRIGYVEAPRTWSVWAKRGVAPDFKTINRPQISEVASMTERLEGKEITYVTLTDSKESYALKEYSNGIRLTRRSLINDDLNALADVPQKQGQAAARLEDDVAYAILTANAALADTVALFHGTHANLASATAVVGAPTVATVSATEKLIMLQKGPKSAAILNLIPKFWLGPVALKTTAEQFFASRVDPSKNNDTPNPYNGKITPIANARLDADSSTEWYLMADYRDGQIDTIEVCFLTDEPEPVLKQETEFDTDDVKYAVRHTVAAKALEYRGMARNNGA